MWDRSGKQYALQMQQLRQGTHVFDIGAHEGLWSLSAVDVISANIQIHAFEPDPQSFAVLATRLASHKLINSGVGSVAGQFPFFRYLDSAYNSFRWRTDQASTGILASVPVIRLDEYCVREGINEVDFCKVDAEGMDLDVLQSFGDMLASVRIIQFEHWGSDLPSFQELLVRTHEITEIEKGLYRAEVRR